MKGKAFFKGFSQGEKNVVFLFSHFLFSKEKANLNKLY
jgi:hypothetical protein